MEIKRFAKMFNEFYPFERYIMNNPKTITDYFDDVVLTEIFIPSTEIKRIEKGGQVLFTQIKHQDIYIKVKGSAGEMRFALWDFSDDMIDVIINCFVEDFGGQAWQDLYTEYETDWYLADALEKQIKLITSKYGECNIKPNFIKDETIELINEIKANKGE